MYIHQIPPHIRYAAWYTHTSDTPHYAILALSYSSSLTSLNSHSSTTTLSPSSFLLLLALVSLRCFATSLVLALFGAMPIYCDCLFFVVHIGRYKSNSEEAGPCVLNDSKLVSTRGGGSVRVNVCTCVPEPVYVYVCMYTCRGPILGTYSDRGF